MKVIGLILAAAGMILLANQGFHLMAADSVGVQETVTADRGPTTWLMPVLAGIAVVGGLMMIAMGTDRRIV